ncbi:hypothetical protein DK389_19385 [Methylobacterium durans]|uniref:Uncharacterized protein n=1 Tax=Methylobacterium durans TaxID=2202825 RepID=A0A2U8W823_9HYPH|nr:hypothetical protein DK389_19385 [Methylobacterium durans]
MPYHALKRSIPVRFVRTRRLRWAKPAGKRQRLVLHRLPDLALREWMMMGPSATGTTIRFT